MNSSLRREKDGSRKLHSLILGDYLSLLRVLEEVAYIVHRVDQWFLRFRRKERYNCF